MSCFGEQATLADSRGKEMLRRTVRCSVRCCIIAISSFAWLGAACPLDRSSEGEGEGEVADEGEGEGETCAPLDEACSSDTDCCEPLQCVGETGFQPGVCADVACENPISCTSDSDCCEGTTCVGFSGFTPGECG
jgi:hypothetical protein